MYRATTSHDEDRRAKRKKKESCEEAKSVYVYNRKLSDEIVASKSDKIKLVESKSGYEEQRSRKTL